MKNAIALGLVALFITAPAQADALTEMCSSMRVASGHLHDLAQDLDYATYNSFVKQQAIANSGGDRAIQDLLETTGQLSWDNRFEDKYSFQQTVETACRTTMRKYL